MSFCLRPNVCKECGKPLTLFEGWTCLECEKAEQEPTDLNEAVRIAYEQGRKDALEEVRAEISDLPTNNVSRKYAFDVIDKYKIVKIIDKHKGE